MVAKKPRHRRQRDKFEDHHATFDLAERRDSLAGCTT
jgi:hypothetical protein